ncbi:DUF3291 domain-containing protein [Loktanella agnita]|uniref:DUF3291 domain-containing protein n=1 Tax=Loktanella agnita TaxID=287097 RepID=UPI0039880144
MKTFEKPNPDWQLAEVNIACLKKPAGDPLVAPFVDAIDKVNAIADRMDGFVWRYTDASGNATDTSVDVDERIIFNTSIWQDLPSLERFVWGTVHMSFFRRRKEWFNVMEKMHFAMWWVPQGTTITPQDAMERLAYFNNNGATERAFDWAHAPDIGRWKNNDSR